MIRNGIAYVDAFGETYGEAVYMGLFESLKTSSSYPLLGCIMHILQNFLTWSIFMLTSQTTVQSVVQFRMVNNWVHNKDCTTHKESKH